MKQRRPFGLWPSPLQPADLAQETSIRDLAWDSDGKSLVWLERRGERGVLVCQGPSDAPRDLTTSLSVRARVGYGGGDFTVGRGIAYFVEADGRIYRQELQSSAATPITPGFGHAASPRLSRDGQWLVYVHSENGTDRLAIVDSQGRLWPQRLAEGADFYMQPAWHPDGRSLAWIEWDHPNMPWDGSRLVLGHLQRGRHHPPRLSKSQVLAGGDRVAIFQVEFGTDGRTVFYTSDERGHSNLWRHDIYSEKRVCLTEDDGDVGIPAWAQGMRVFAPSADGQLLYFTRAAPDDRQLWSIDLVGGVVTLVPEFGDYASIEQIAAAPRGHGLAGIASGARISARAVSSSQRGGACRILARTTGEAIPPAALAETQPLTFHSEGGDQLYGLLYPPASADFEAEGLPPAVIMVHGGPTGRSDVCYNPKAQFLATRGYAVLDLDYRGSSGYGRSYQEALAGRWGVADVEDAVAAAAFMTKTERANGNRLVLMGSSAGGCTVLRTLTLHPGLFRAGVCAYGISNLLGLAADTHKFEAHYLDSLLGPLPEFSAVYRDRSPLFAADQLADPIALFHGTDDNVVPRDQADDIVASLRRRGVPHEYHLYEGEGHGWRRPKTVEAFYSALERFLQRHVIFA